MSPITKTEALVEFCRRAKDHPYITIDTEFLRERTYYSKLCLVQIAYPGEDEESAVLVDPLSPDLSLDPLLELMQDKNVVKVFHAARQDLEIFFLEFGVMPEPLFDTQVAAMVCGFGEQAGYETLVRKIANQSLDKSSRFTNWALRPLSNAQLKYALADVTHLRVIYEYLAKTLDKNGRQSWLVEEMQVLKAPETYRIQPENAWKRLKTRTNSGKFLAIARELAKFREDMAQTRNIPRNRIMKDDALLELASTKPRDMKELSRSRLLLREARKGDIADGILAAIKAGLEVEPKDYPPVDTKRDKLQVNPALADLLRVLLKAKSEEAGVAQKLIANASELDEISAGRRDLPSLKGWRGDVFGNDALRLCDGEIALKAKGNQVVVVTL